MQVAHDVTWFVTVRKAIVRELCPRIVNALLFPKHKGSAKGREIGNFSRVRFLAGAWECKSKATNHVALKLSRNQSRTHDIRGRVLHMTISHTPQSLCDIYDGHIWVRSIQQILGKTEILNRSWALQIIRSSLKWRFNIFESTQNYSYRLFQIKKSYLRRLG